ncbi:MAG: helix-turn-helix transcriptional regulator [Actinomycetota bacterium]|nr:helix-turn-helix transcriptional regulator [Actinomycetota bacterium]
MVLVRHLIGEVLRQERVRQGRTLRDVSQQATISLGYLSEVERGVKEASSECLAAICAALDVPLSSVLQSVSIEFGREEGTATVAPLTAIGSASRLPDVVAAA